MTTISTLARTVTPGRRFDTRIRLTLPVVLATLLAACLGEEPEPPTETVFSHKSNVFAAVENWYVDEWWTENAEYQSGPAIAQQSTAIWFNRIGDIAAYDSGVIQGIRYLGMAGAPIGGYLFDLRDHLLAAEAQDNALIQLVLNSLPGRDCAKEATERELPQSELPASEPGMRAYREHFIDRAVNILKDFPHLPVAIILEPHSLSQIAVNHELERCREVDNRHSYGYVNGVRYAVNRLSELENVHIYLDAGASDLFGRDEELAIASLFTHGVITGFDTMDEQLQRVLDELDTASAQRLNHAALTDIFIEPPIDPAGGTHPPGYDKISGFITNVAGYVPLHEPYLGDPREPTDGPPLMSAPFYNGSPRFDEWTYTVDWLDALRSHGADVSHMGMLIDTSRNGWGQADRSLDLAPTQDPALVDELRIDHRLHRGNWCNQPGGIGARPQALPDDKAWIHAYLWVKRPGESDGPSDDFFDGNDFNYLRNPWCIPDNLIERDYVLSEPDVAVSTGALPDSPLATRWFTTGFTTLIENAWPPLCEGKNDVCD